MTPDEDLAARAAQGDLDALATLYRAWVDRVYRYAYTHLGNRTDAEDATAETWLRVARYIHGYQRHAGTGGWGAWVFTIARNVTHDQASSTHRRHQREVLTDATWRPPGDTEISAEDRVLTHQRSEHLIAAIRQLPPKGRAVVTLRFLGQLSVAETAAVIGTTEGAVKQAQRRALCDLREMLAEEGSGAEHVVELAGDGEEVGCYEKK